MRTPQLTSRRKTLAILGSSGLALALAACGQAAAGVTTPAPSQSAAAPAAPTIAPTAAPAAAVATATTVSSASSAASASAVATATTAPVTSAASSVAKQTTIRVLFWADGADMNLFPKWTQQFTQAVPSIKVEVDGVPGKDYHTKLKAQISAGDPPDFFDDNASPQYAYLKVLTPLETYVARDKIDLNNYWSVSVNAKKWQGQLVAFPAHTGAKALVYNVDLLKAAGLPDPNDLFAADKWDWQAFLDTCQKLSKQQGGQRVQFGMTDVGDYFNWLAENKASVLSADLKTVTITEPNAVEAIQYMQDLIWKHHVVPSADEKKALPAGTDVWGSSKAAMFQGWDSWDSYDKEVGGHFTWDAVPLPKGTVMGSLGGTNGWNIPSGSKLKDESWQLIKFISTSMDIQTEIAAKLEIPALKAAADSYFSSADAASSPPKHKKLATLDPYDKGYLYNAERFTFPKWDEASAVIGKELGLVWSNQQSAQDACQKIAAPLEAIVKSLG